jgi:hypothetical protein
MGRWVAMRCSSFLSLLLLLGLGLVSQSAEGQSVESQPDRPHLGLGYVVNAPNMMAGVGGYAIFDVLGGLGLYIDAKFDIETPAGDDYFESGLSVEEAENTVPGIEFVESENSFRALNFALVRPVNPQLLVYVGGGVVNVSQYHLYQSDSDGLGQGGVFWVEDTDWDEVRGNLMVGAFFRLSSFLSSQVGFETEPRGFTAGLSVRLPNR